MQNQKLQQALDYVVLKVNKTADVTGQKLEDFIRNDQAMRPIFVAAHSRLPVFIRLLLKEERFVELMLNNREKLLIHRQIQPIIEDIISRLLKK